MPKRHNLILGPMNNEDWAFNLRSIVDIRKLVPHHCEAKIECHTVCTEERTLEYDTSDAPAFSGGFRCKVTGRATAKGSAIEYYLFRLEKPNLKKVAIRGLYVSVAVRFVRCAV
mmetsp:Transcript_5591/g.11652  ORF Transcript_5591/g.11652 Transcript_5591/m.11652 type:complete len:114 (-) Transcript_5591:532-873(-)